MIINWYGEACFKIQTGGVTILTDPFDSSTGLTPPRFKADIVLKTLTVLPIPYQPTTEERIVAGGGEYEIAGVEIRGWRAEADEKFLKTIFRVRAEDMTLGFLGHLTAPLAPESIEEVAGIDILFVPAGGKPLIGQEDMAKIIKQIGPKIIVPSLVKVPGLKRAAADVKEFLEELGQKAQPQEKLTIKKKELPASTQVVILTI